MTLLALPKPGPPPVPSAAVACCQPNRLAKLKPNTAEPPTRNNSRRVIPSHVSLLIPAGITNMIGSSMRYFQGTQYINKALREFSLYLLFNGFSEGNVHHQYILTVLATSIT